MINTKESESKIQIYNRFLPLKVFNHSSSKISVITQKCYSIRYLDVIKKCIYKKAAKTPEKFN